VLATDTVVEDVSIEHHPVERYLSGSATYFILLTLLRDVP